MADASLYPVWSVDPLKVVTQPAQFGKYDKAAALLSNCQVRPCPPEPLPRFERPFACQRRAVASGRPPGATMVWVWTEVLSSRSMPFNADVHAGDGADAGQGVCHVRVACVHAPVHAARLAARGLRGGVRAGGGLPGALPNAVSACPSIALDVRAHGDGRVG